MSCHQTLLMLSAYVDGETSRVETQMVDDHLAACETCATEMNAMRSVRALIEDIPEVSAPEFLLSRIQALTVDRPVRAGHAAGLLNPIGGARRYMVATAACAAAVAGIALVSTISPQGGGTTAPTVAENVPSVPSPNPSAPVARITPSITGRAGASISAASEPDVAQPAQTVTHRRPSHRRQSSSRRPTDDLVARTPSAVRPAAPKPAKGTVGNDVAEKSDALKPVATGTVDGVVVEAPKVADVATVTTDEPKPSGPMVIARAGGEDRKAALAESASTVNEQLRRSIAARNRERKYMRYSSAQEPLQISVDVATLRF